MNFYELVLPERGSVCIAETYKKGFKHTWFKEDQHKEAIEWMMARDKAGATMYMAQASFDPAKIVAAVDHNAQLPKNLTKDEWRQQRKRERCIENALLLKCFFLDIDCGDDKPYATQGVGLTALIDFVKVSGLPMPTVTNSGNGLYAHWILTKSVDAQIWRGIANLLKRVIDAHGFKPDIGLTANAACVLRGPGTHNRKKETKEVKHGPIEPPIELSEFTKVLHAAARKKKIDTSIVDPPKRHGTVNADLEVYSNAPTSHPDLIAEKCAHLKNLRDTRGNIEEPDWYDCLGVLAFCIDGLKFAHEWSKGHPGYTEAGTLDKFQQRHHAAGPTTCVKFGAGQLSELCTGCPYKGKVKSPIQLGHPDPEPMKEDEETGETILCPPGFRRTTEGIFANVDDEYVKIYPYDLSVTSCSRDDSLGGLETSTIRHYLPHAGVKEFQMPSRLVQDKKQCLMHLNDNHIGFAGPREKNLMVQYIEQFQNTLRESRRINNLFTQMGWKEKSPGLAFVLGDRVFHEDGTVECAALAKNLPYAAQGFFSGGELSEWINTTKVLDAPGMEAHAFALLAGGFGAPLMRFTGYEGAMVSLVGPSGTGKTLVSRWAQSIYGMHIQLMMQKDDTKNSLISRLGTYGSLPLTIDEVSNMDPKDCSELAYRVTQGRDKARLFRDGTERKELNHWSTIALVSSNHSLLTKLSAAKADASAEINRIFEYGVHFNQALNRDAATEVYRSISKHFGKAGPVYIKYLVEKHKQHADQLDLLAKRIEVKADLAPDERFWSAIGAVAMYGGLIAKKLDLIKFSVAALEPWIISTIKDMQYTKSSYVTDCISLLGQFLNKYASNVLIVDGISECGPKSIARLVHGPRGQLTHRVELDTNNLYIPKVILRDFLYQVHGDLNKFVMDLDAVSAVKQKSSRKVLGANTQDYKGAIQNCIVVDLSCPALGNIVAKAVEVSSPEPGSFEEAIESI